MKVGDEVIVRLAHGGGNLTGEVVENGPNVLVIRRLEHTESGQSLWTCWRVNMDNVIAWAISEWVPK